MRWWHIVSVVVLVVLIGIGGFYLSEERKVLSADREKLSTEFHALTTEKKLLEAKIQALEDPENLVQEIKAQFNYRKPDENLIIIVPSTTSAE
jgi:cell division protein FtsB